MSYEPKVCEHGSLRRSCLLCEFTDEIARLRAQTSRLEGEVERLTRERAEADDCEREEIDRETRENAALRAGSEAALKEALGPELFVQLWGPELEALGRLLDSAVERSSRLEGELQRARGVLRRLEWSDHSYGRLWCPVCSGTPGTSWSDGHAPDCALSAALGEG